MTERQFPSCGSSHVVNIGDIHYGKPNHKCKACGPQFVDNPQQQLIPQQTKTLVDKLLLEKIPLAGIARFFEVSESWLQNYVNRRYEAVPRQVSVSTQSKGPLRIQCDEMWSFVNDKGNKQWIWLAQDVSSCKIIGVLVGDRSGQGAQKLWESLPAVYRQCAVVYYTDFGDAYALVFPQKRHMPVGKETGKTSYIERFNCTMRQRVTRLVHKALSFSKKIENHIAAIWMFVHHYNASLPVVGHHIVSVGILAW